MDKLIRGQFELWLASHHIEGTDELRRVGLELDAMMQACPNYLELESKVNEYQNLTAEYTFCEGFEQALALTQRAGRAEP